ncbi:phospholipase A2 inhibitor NAI-like [Elgaria multicarinata webbii]|uniref:phospholipase A2 inhibitor NAI-like n=1 Tax=Elgaria multicarinata webbii TaxID=159646 RepID=UPI002FCCBC8F
MQALLGLYLFSLLLTIGASLECETCIAEGKTCTGQKVKCSAGLDTCATVLTEVTVGSVTTQAIGKGCYLKSECNNGKTVEANGMTITTTINCNNASPLSAASFLLALSGVMLMKFLL